MHQFIKLVFYRLNHFRMSVTNVEYTDTAGKVDHALAVCVPQFCVCCVVGKLFIGTCRSRCNIAFFECLQFFIAHFAILPVSLVYQFD